MEDLVVRQVSWDQEQQTLLDIRTEVFVEEQEVPVEEEIDGLDPDSMHFLATLNEQNIGTARLLPSGQIGRMAVLKPFRNLGVGGRLLNLAIETALQEGHETIFLHAQVHALDFYAEHGFIAHGDVFLDAGIEHREMTYQPK